MGIFPRLAYLFFLGSTYGWVLELFFRRFFSKANPEHKWINPGFCVRAVLADLRHRAVRPVPARRAPA